MGSKLSAKELKKALDYMRKYAIKPSPKGNYYLQPHSSVLKDRKIMRLAKKAGIEFVHWNDPDYKAYRKLNGCIL